MRVTVYRAQDGWRWQGIADTGEIVSDSAEAYEDKFHAIAAAKSEKRRAHGRQYGHTAAGNIGGRRQDELQALILASIQVQ